MPNTIYATFPTEHDAERAAGALMDHGVAAEEISFILPENLPATAHVDAAGMPRTHSPEAVPPTAIPITNDYSLQDIPVPMPPQAPALTVPQPNAALEPEVGMPAHYRYDALGAVLPDNTPRGAVLLDESPIKTAVPANTPLDTIEHDSRPHAHIVDMKREMPTAASGISTTTSGDAAKGALEGAGIGVGLGILLGLATILIPGVGLVAGAGALVAGLAAATGAAGSVAGGVYGYLADMGLPPDTARHLHEQMQAGQIILSVSIAGEISTDEIISLLRKYHATSAQAF